MGVRQNDGMDRQTRKRGKAAPRHGIETNGLAPASEKSHFESQRKDLSGFTEKNDSSFNKSDQSHVTHDQPQINEVRGGVLNPFYDHAALSPPRCRPIREGDLVTKLIYYIITCPIAITRIALGIGTMFIYFNFLLLIMPLLFWLRRQSAKKMHGAETWADPILYKLLLLWPGRLCGFFTVMSTGYSVKMNGMEHLQKAYASRKPFVCVCNHVSYVDVGVLCFLLGPFSAVAKADIAKIPVLGWVASAWGCFYIDRSKKRSDKEMHELSARLTDRANKMGPWAMQPPLLVFPEGTTTSGEAVTKFRLGAFRTGVDILPIVLDYDTGDQIGRSWSPPYDGREHFFRVLATWSKSVKVTVLPIHRQDRSKSAEEVAVSVQKDMAQCLGVPAALEWGLKDAIAFYKTIYQAFGTTEAKSANGIHDK